MALVIALYREPGLDAEVKDEFGIDQLGRSRSPDERCSPSDGVGMLVMISAQGGKALTRLWKELASELGYWYREVSRLAFVGEPSYQDKFAALSRPFTSAEVRFYPESEISAARAWVQTRSAT